MEKKIFFEDARKSMLEMFSYEFPLLTINDVDLFVGMFYHLINYEEEGTKIRPNLIVTSNINSLVKNISHTQKITFYEDEDTSNFRAHIKALMCFCIRGWNIYINFGEGVVEYGIIKRLVSIKEPSLIQSLRNKSVMDGLSKKTNLILIQVQGGGVGKLTGGKGTNISVCFNLNSQSEYNWENEISDFVESSVSKLKTTKRKLEDIKQMLTNIFRKSLSNSHGTICMLVDKDYKDKNGFLADGTWLKEPIEFGKMFIKSNTYDESKLRGLADVLTTMLDFDGITVIDNAGRIRAYNVFIENSATASKKVIGGARRRAAYTILENKNKKIIGVYFQSQDGDNFYKEKSDLRKKKKIKIVGGEVVNENDEMLPLEIIAKLQQTKKSEEEKKPKTDDEKKPKAENKEKKKEKVEDKKVEKSEDKKVEKTEDKKSDDKTKEKVAKDIEE